MTKKELIAIVLLMLAIIIVAVAPSAHAQVPSSLTNPDAVPHHIDRSAMKVPLQGWSPDLRYPVYPIAVMRGESAVYYTTNERVKTYSEFDFPELRCEIGDAPKEVLKDPKYECADGVCFTKRGGGIIGTDPRIKAKKAKC